MVIFAIILIIDRKRVRTVKEKETEREREMQSMKKEIETVKKS